MKSFPTYLQTDMISCGPICLWLILSFYKRNYSLVEILKMSKLGETGISLYELGKVAGKLGFDSEAIKLNCESLTQVKVLPCIAYKEPGHFFVIYKIEKDEVFVSDPLIGLISYKTKDFKKIWVNESLKYGFLFLLKLNKKE